jgi:hypothetical protein
MNSQCNAKFHSQMYDSKQFATEYAQQLMSYNNQYLDLLDTKNQFLATIQMLETSHYMEGKPYHMINPQAEEAIIDLGLDRIEGLDEQPKLRTYLYLDDNLLYKTKTMPPNNNPFINLDISM